jgi:MFS family permease
MPIRALQGLSAAAIIPLSNLLAANILGSGRGVGAINMVGSLGFLVGGVAGGILLESYSYPAVFASTCIAPIAAVIALLLPWIRLTVGSEVGRIKLSDIRRLGRGLTILYTSFFLRQLGASGVWTLFSLYIFSLGGDAYLVSLTAMANMLTQTLIFERVGRMSEGRGEVVFGVGLLLSSIVFLSYYLIEDPILILPIQLLLALSWTTLYAGINVYIVESVDEEVKATALGLVGTSLSLGWIAGSSLAGLIADIYGTYKVWILIASILSLTAYLITETYRRFWGFKQGASQR